LEERHRKVRLSRRVIKGTSAYLLGTQFSSLLAEPWPCLPSKRTNQKVLASQGTVPCQGEGPLTEEKPSRGRGSISDIGDLPMPRICAVEKQHTGIASRSTGLLRKGEIEYKIRQKRPVWVHVEGSARGRRGPTLERGLCGVSIFPGRGRAPIEGTPEGKTFYRSTLEG